MKRYLLIFMIMLGAGAAMAQSHVSDLLVTPASGGTIKWYNDPTAGTQYTDPTNTALVNGTTYYASQTVNGVESAARKAVTATLNPQPQGSLTANGPFCAAAAGMLTWTATTGTGSYTVTYFDGTANRTVSQVDSGTPFEVFTSPVSSTTTYTLVSVNDLHCSRTSAFTAGLATITVNAVPSAPTTGTHVATQTQIVWNWNTVSGATGYKWNTTNNYSSATDLTTNRTITQTGLTCGQSNTIYVWAYNANCNSSTTTLTQSTSTCLAEIAGGAASVCDGSTTPAFTNATSGGTWSISSGGSYASINSNGIVTGLNPGSATVAYTLAGNTKTASISVVSCTTVRNDGVDAYSLTASSAKLMGMMYPGGPNATRQGFKYSTDPNFNPASEGIDASVTGDFPGNVPFSQIISGLSNGTTYYFYAYTTTSNGTAYSTITNAAGTTNGKYAFAFFGYTGAEQTFTVPTGAKEVGLYTWGASGGSSTFGGVSSGGRGGYWQKTRTGSDVPSGTLYVYVGGKGADGTSSITGVNAGGWNGGGDGYGNGGGGGGATDIRMGGNALSNRISVGSGGGGTAYQSTNNATGGAAELTAFDYKCNGLYSGAYNATYCGTGVPYTVYSGGAAATSGGSAGVYGLGGDGSAVNNSTGGGAGFYGGGAGYNGGGGAGSCYSSVAGGGVGTLQANMVSSAMIFISF